MIQASKREDFIVTENVSNSIITGVIKAVTIIPMMIDSP
jgi:hypothetical protein